MLFSQDECCHLPPICAKTYEHLQRCFQGVYDSHGIAQETLFLCSSTYGINAAAQKVEEAWGLAPQTR